MNTNNPLRNEEIAWFGCGIAHDNVYVFECRRYTKRMKRRAALIRSQ